MSEGFNQGGVVFSQDDCAIQRGSRCMHQHLRRLPYNGGEDVCTRSITRGFSLEWVAHAFDVGRPHGAVYAGCGRKNPLGVLRLQTSQGCFAVKRFAHVLRGGALAIEPTAYAAGFPMPRPLWTIDIII